MELPCFFTISAAQTGGPRSCVGAVLIGGRVVSSPHRAVQQAGKHGGVVPLEAAIKVGGCRGSSHKAYHPASSSLRTQQRRLLHVVCHLWSAALPLLLGLAGSAPGLLAGAREGSKLGKLQAGMFGSASRRLVAPATHGGSDRQQAARTWAGFACSSCSCSSSEPPSSLQWAARSSMGRLRHWGTPAGLGSPRGEPYPSILLPGSA